MSGSCEWPIPHAVCANFRAANLKRSGQATRRCSITRPHSNKLRKPSRFKVILLQVLGLAVAVAFLQLLFPVFTQMVVDKVIVENDIGLLKTILLGIFAALVFVQLATLAQEYLIAFAAVRLDTAILDFLSRKLLSLPMTYFTSRRTGDIQRRLDGARQVRQFAVQQGVGALLGLIFLVGALFLMGLYSPLLMIAFL
ncbi:MAG: hypothetical protein DMF34_06460, partial [Verrucomicrobia bacterium]